MFHVKQFLGRSLRIRPPGHPSPRFNREDRGPG